MQISCHSHYRLGHHFRHSQLLQYGTELNMRSAQGDSALHLAWVPWQRLSTGGTNPPSAKMQQQVRNAVNHTIELLLNAPGNTCNPNIANESTKRTPLHMSIAFGNFHATVLLLKHGAHRHHRDSNGETPCELALRLQQKDIITVMTNWEWIQKELQSKVFCQAWRQFLRDPDAVISSSTPIRTIIEGILQDERHNKAVALQRIVEAEGRGISAAHCRMTAPDDLHPSFLQQAQQNLTGEHAENPGQRLKRLKSKQVLAEQERCKRRGRLPLLLDGTSAHQAPHSTSGVPAGADVSTETSSIYSGPGATDTASAPNTNTSTSMGRHKKMHLAARAQAYSDRPQQPRSSWRPSSERISEARYPRRKNKFVKNAVETAQTKTYLKTRACFSGRAVAADANYRTVENFDADRYTPRFACHSSILRTSAAAYRDAVPAHGGSAPSSPSTVVKPASEIGKVGGMITAKKAANKLKSYPPLRKKVDTLIAQDDPAPVDEGGGKRAPVALFAETSMLPPVDAWRNSTGPGESKHSALHPESKGRVLHSSMACGDSSSGKARRPIHSKVGKMLGEPYQYTQNSNFLIAGVDSSSFTI